MSIKNLTQNFISHSPEFYSDLELNDLDNKHTIIVKDAYNFLDDSGSYNKNNFRDWSAQGDQGAPIQISKFNISTNGFLYTVIKFLYVNIFRRDIQRNLLHSFKDDISIIKSIGGESILKENPVHSSPGATAAYFIEGTSVNFRWLRYIYISQQVIKNNLLPDSGVWVDVGSYYGGCQSILRKYFPNTTNVMVDFHHQLCRSYIFLSQIYPNAEHILPDQISNYESLDAIPKSSFVYLPVSDYHKIANQKVDLVTNFFSLGEMRREFYSVYMDSILFKESKNVYLINRVMSSPFFEKTYDTDISIIDYISNKEEIDYFDIFPMAHYYSIKRELFGRIALRNEGSSYFEMMTSKK